MLTGAEMNLNCVWMQLLFELQLRSIAHYNIATFSEDTKVHFITQRYAQLTTSLLLLNADYNVRSFITF